MRSSSVDKKSANETASCPNGPAISGHMITPLLHFLRRASLPRSQQSLPRKARLTVQFVNLSTALETCFASRLDVCMTARAHPSRLRFTVLTVNFTIHNQPLPITQRALENPESRVLTVNFTIRDPVNAQASSASVETRFSVSFVNFTIRDALCTAARVRSSRPQFGVQTANPSTSLRTCLSTTLETYLARKTNISRLPQSPLPRVQFVNFASHASAATDPVAVARQVSLKDRS